MTIKLEKISVTTTGSAGSATGSGTTGVLNGRLLAVYLDFNASTPNTTDTTIAYAEKGGNLLVVTNSNTDAMFAPRMTCVTNANAAITNSHAPFPLNQKLTISLAQADAVTNAVVAYIWYEED